MIRPCAPDGPHPGRSADVAGMDRDQINSGTSPYLVHSYPNLSTESIGSHLETGPDLPTIYMSHSVSEGKLNVNYVCARIRNSHTQRLHN
jgi:hypothetical protein